VALLVGLLTLYSMGKIWAGAFLPKAPANFPVGPMPADMRRSVIVLSIPVAALALMTLVIGLYAGPFYDLAERAADQLLNPTLYIQAVLNP
jgi:multicomponent Na+:H+ antiporter subunit D